MKSKLIFQFLLVLSIGFLAALGCNSSGAAPETINSEAEIEKSNQQRATSASSNGFTIELAKNEDDADVLIITMKGLPAWSGLAMAASSKASCIQYVIVPEKPDETFTLANNNPLFPRSKCTSIAMSSPSLTIHPKPQPMRS